MKKTFDKVAEVIRDVMNRTMCVLEDPQQFGKEDKLKVNSTPHTSFPFLYLMNFNIILKNRLKT